MGEAPGGRLSLSPLKQPHSESWIPGAWDPHGAQELLFRERKTLLNWWGWRWGRSPPPPSPHPHEGEKVPKSEKQKLINKEVSEAEKTSRHLTAFLTQIC